MRSLQPLQPERGIFAVSQVGAAHVVAAVGNHLKSITDVRWSLR